MGAVSVIVVPEGSEAHDSVGNSSIELLCGALTNTIDSLTNGSSVSGLSYSNPTSASYVTVVVTLAPITPTSGGKITIDNGTDAYELELSTTNSMKVARFYNIPAAFTTSFTVTNNSGVTLAGAGNSVVVMPVETPA